MHPKKFNVEVCFDVTDGDVRFWLESVELADLKQSLRDEVIDHEIGELQDLLIMEQ